MIQAGPLVAALQGMGFECFVGVPDSLLKDLCAELERSLPRNRHIVAANEGAAVAIAMGYYLRAGNPAFVYLQNSGLGNAINPLLSLADKEVYGIPMVLVIGWRGEPGGHDEPQHVKQGRIMCALLDALELPWSILPLNQDEAVKCFKRARDRANEEQQPQIILIQKGAIGGAIKAVSTAPDSAEYPSREEALIALMRAIGNDAIVVSTTGMLSRELYEYRKSNSEVGKDLLVVGGMGHASSVALGITLREPSREVWCLDGDGAVLMHMGSLPVLAAQKSARLHHVVFNNGVHDSVGGQPTVINTVNLGAFARAVGYVESMLVTDCSFIPGVVTAVRKAGGPTLIEIRVRPGNRSDLGRPKETPSQAKAAFMSRIK